MKLGEVFYFTSDQALGYAERNKFHVYMCEAAWPFQDEGPVFLFISKADYGGDYLIKKEHYPFLTLDESYVSCGRAVAYSKPVLTKMKMESKGQLSADHLKELYAAIAKSETMEQGQIKLLCEALKVVL
jgi:hypothetical protein